MRKHRRYQPEAKVRDGAAVRAICEACHVSQRELARAIGKSQMMVWKIEHGEDAMTAEVRQAVARFLCAKLARMLIRGDT